MKKCLFAFFIGGMLLLNSCASRKIVYVQDMLPDTTYRSIEAPALRIQRSDRLSIVVSAKSPELAVPFNQGFGNYQVDDRGDVSTTSSSSFNTKGYLVDDHGNIEFPILGTLALAGLTLDEVKEKVKSKLVDEKLISDPIIKVDLLNLKINMMGQVKNVGVLNVPDARITLLEAISRSGGLATNAAEDRVIVIREEDGERKMVVNNIESIDIFNSSTYYLQQNDIVYIEPRDAELTQKAQNNLRYTTTAASVLAALFTILNFLK